MVREMAAMTAAFQVATAAKRAVVESMSDDTSGSPEAATAAPQGRRDGSPA